MANEMQKSEQKPGTQITIRDRLNSEAFQKEIARVLPTHVTAERMARVAVTALMRNPKLAECTQESFFKCMLDLSQWGLEPDGKRAHLIPFKNTKKNVYECQLVVGYGGLAELVYRSGLVSYIHADVLREGDIFAYSKGELQMHVPWFMRFDADKPKEAGKVFGAYAMVRMKDGGEKTDVMSYDEIISIRDNSQGWRAFKKYGGQSPWSPENPVSEQEMFKKTAFRRLAKWLPLSAEIRRAVEADDDAIDVDSRPVQPGRARVSDLNLQLADNSGLPPMGDHDDQDDHDEDTGDQGEQDGEGQGEEPKLTVEQISEQWLERIGKAKKRSELNDINAELINGEKRLTNDQKMPIVEVISKKLSTLKNKAAQGDMLDQQ